MIRSILSDRWQTVIPAEIRNALGLKPNQGLLYELHGEGVLLRPEGTSLMDLAGCLHADGPAISKTEARYRAHQHVADNFQTSPQDS